MLRAALAVAALVAMCAWLGFALRDLTSAANTIRQRAAQAEGA